MLTRALQRSLSAHKLPALYVFASGESLSHDALSEVMAHDPVVVDLVASLLIAGGTLAWYLWSTSRKALASLFR
ncbi:hypothetical protein [Roseobacter sp. N2S]|uniref:hypothetical protein n=1 Tax=Roseobacter sp. N2S TaxID=2663844 RepID=UPI00286437FC|nr:hypothetical protein [Roseobacter sp. N2S]MDR6265283.1 hypothetical protein [Roseobacter sp. N2S]